MSVILFLPNILINHLCINKKSSEILNETVIYDKLENKNFMEFITENQEIESFACWNCTLVSENKWFIPIDINRDIKIKKKDDVYRAFFIDNNNKKEHIEIKRFGNFCSIICAYRFLHETIEIEESSRQNYYALLIYVYFKKTGKRISFIPYALPKHAMKKYGGIMTEEEYREKNKKIEENDLLFY
jgi:hypothetical protein